MPSYPTPGKSQLAAAFEDHGVDFTITSKTNLGRNAWTSGLRAATVHHTAGKNSLSHLQSFRWGGANALIQHGGYNGTAKDGKAIILCWGSAWHSGTGGPWPGVAARDSLHLTSWGIEIESLGTRQDMTDKQIDTVGRMLAALVDLGMPLGHIHRHADWTDGTPPVGGHPLPTNGRKIDTNKRWYPTSYWVEQARRHLELWDGITPEFEAVVKAEVEHVANPAAWRLACRLADLGHFKGTPKPRGEQGYPVKAVQTWQDSIGADPTGQYGPRAHQRIFNT